MNKTERVWRSRREPEPDHPPLISTAESVDVSGEDDTKSGTDRSISTGFSMNWGGEGRMKPLVHDWQWDSLG
ncbi:hypothetical protein NG799_20865 [Laspinema sp. D1]|uniref:Uncharacterized protein n=1 Tax=Laspinema palackyanum D2a TaxID=2953684 RepID=A0ABT2MVI6_9CYAN|nr:hypothetical protein [Laspinema sp. D2a]